MLVLVALLVLCLSTWSSAVADPIEVAGRELPELPPDAFISEIRRDFDAEARDDEWAAEREALIIALLTSAGGAYCSSFDISCRANLCRMVFIDFDNGSPDAQEVFVQIEKALSDSESHSAGGVMQYHRAERIYEYYIAARPGYEIDLSDRVRYRE